MPKGLAKGRYMNTDFWLMVVGVAGGLIGFLLGYAKGHEHGKIAGRLAIRRQQRNMVNR